MRTLRDAYAYAPDCIPCFVFLNVRPHCQADNKLRLHEDVANSGDGEKLDVRLLDAVRAHCMQDKSQSE